MNPTGEQVVEALLAYIAKSGKPWASIGRKEFARIYDEAFPKEPLKPKQNPSEEWLQQMKDDPANEGLDIDKLLVKARFWALQNRRICTRKFFVNWLLNAEREIGPGQTAVKALPELAGWKFFLEERKAMGLFPQPIPHLWESLSTEHKQLVHGQKFRLDSMVKFATENPSEWKQRLEEIKT